MGIPFNKKLDRFNREAKTYAKAKQPCFLN